MGRGGRRGEEEEAVGGQSLQPPTWRVVVGWAVMICCCSSGVATSQSLTRPSYGAPGPQPAVYAAGHLSCYSCHSARSGEEPCTNGTSIQNHTRWQARCAAAHAFCMVRVYKSSSVINGSAAQTRVWSVERSCVEECDQSCLIIGERTKIISCVTCCSEDLCNYADAAATSQQVGQTVLWLCAIAALVKQCL